MGPVLFFAEPSSNSISPQMLGSVGPHHPLEIPSGRSSARSKSSICPVVLASAISIPIDDLDKLVAIAMHDLDRHLGDPPGERPGNVQDLDRELGGPPVG